MANETSVLARRDVNVEFASEKLAQLATIRERREWLEKEREAGNIRLQGNRYIVLRGWDRGESFDAKTTDPDHGLDVTESGGVALYLKDRPAWHSLGTVIKGGSSNARTVLSTAGMDWDTLQAPLTAKLPVAWFDNGEPSIFEEKLVADTFVNYRSDTFQPLGTVGKLYTPVHNSVAFEFLDHLFGDHLMIAESAGSFREGRRVFISAELPDHLILDPEGIADHIRMFLVLINSHDGTTPFMALVTPWRPVCKNTERLAVANAVYKWTVRHTKNAMGKIEEAKRSLNLTTAYYEEFRKEEEELLHTELTMKDVDDFLTDMWGTLDPDADKATATKYHTRTDAVRALLSVEAERVGMNAYAAERAVTGYVDHFAELRPRGALKGNRLAAQGQAIMEETFDNVKSKAHKRLMTLVRK